MTSITERTDAVLVALEADIARAMERAIRRLARFPAAERRRLDPYGFLLRPRGQGARRLG